ncbi:iron-sulfur assembly protein, putative [Hepatocystis sp. ex Piliocolobus tephrosceles]|nr:iron-sulfur assembly protein, putative [Hepatocystis sp. ex Piliocolobus tephrosceles]
MKASDVNKIAYFALRNCNVRTNIKYLMSRSIKTHSFNNNNNNLCKYPMNYLYKNCKRYFSDNNENDVILDWEHFDDIAELLFEEYKNIDPLTLRFEELENMVIDTVVNKNRKKLTGKCNESVLENIQMNWLERYNEECS